VGLVQSEMVRKYWGRCTAECLRWPTWTVILQSRPCREDQLSVVPQLVLTRDRFNERSYGWVRYDAWMASTAECCILLTSRVHAGNMRDRRRQARPSSKLPKRPPHRREAITPCETRPSWECAKYTPLDRLEFGLFIQPYVSFQIPRLCQCSRHHRRAVRLMSCSAAQHFTPPLAMSSRRPSAPPGDTTRNFYSFDNCGSRTS
jgi:hypothetical protein